MIKHIVMWRLYEFAEDNSKENNALIIKEKLESLKNEIPEIIEIEVGIDFLNSEQSYHLVLYSTFANKEDLDIYQNHPKHKEVGNFISKVRTERVVVDYEI